MDTSVSQSLKKNGSSLSRIDEETSGIHKPHILLRPALLSDFYQEISQEQLLELLDSRPHEFKRCKLKTLSHDLAYAKPVTEPALLIKIIGRDDVGRSFPGDEVCVQIVSRQLQPRGDVLLTGKVVGLMHRDDKHCTFICMMDVNSKQLVIPTKKNMTKIHIIQKNPHKIEIRKLHPNSQLWVTEKFIDIAEGQLLLVKVLKWEKHCKYPLGVVTKVLSQEDYALELFKTEFGENLMTPLFQINNISESDVERKDLRDELTFTIDPKGACDLDDAISLTDEGNTYVMAVHITDVASYIRKDTEADIFARKQGTTFYPHHGLPGETAFMLSRELSSKYLSLVPNEERKAISLLTVINKATNTIQSCNFTFSLIRSDRQFSYEEADRIIQKHCLDNAGSLCFSNVKDCVAVAYSFTEMHRKSRLNGGVSSGQLKGKSRAHLMVEELMNLYNSAAAEELISRDLTRDLTPLRCHPGPDHERFEQFKKKYSTLLPLSLHLSHICEGFQNQENYAIQTAHTELGYTETDDIQENDVLIITPIFEEMMDLLQTKDYQRLVHLIISDIMHPSLSSMAKDFLDLQSKALILRSDSSLDSKLGHFNLQLNAYTWATSPMRRYLDLILQRLLHSALFEKQKQTIDYTQREIDQFCESGMECLDRIENYELQATTFITTAQFSCTCVTKLAVVDQLFPVKHSHTFTVSFPLDQVPEQLTIMYRHLKLVEQPDHNEALQSITLRWRRRVYIFSGTTRPHSVPYRNVTPISVDKWKQIISAVKVEDWDKIKGCLKEVDRKPEKQTTGACSEESQHFKEFTLDLKFREVLQVQVGTEVIMGTLAPAVKLLNINPSFEVCLEHARNPVMCFSKAAKSPSKSKYRGCNDYQEIWGELCQMDTAYNAVEENNSVTLEDVPITWTKEAEAGFFKISENQKKEWQLEFDLTNCFLCIRLRGQNVNTFEETGVKQPNGVGVPGHQDLLHFTWVTHAVTKAATQIQGKKKKERNEIQINFQINHQSMTYIPPNVSDKDTTFTVEIIPKKIPYVLSEHAIANINKANDLVKAIATGDVPRNCFRNNVQLPSMDHSLNLPHLNESQERAVQESLKNPFTVIQGPPGTGKTVVGVHITYHFYLKNKMMEAEHLKCTTSADEKKKKHAILYCGPSNKSVDIVAEQLKLLKDNGVLNPLRIYCDQMEMREFPYPGSELKLCRKSLRDDKLKNELRNITLMHLVREPENPFSTSITDMENSSPQEFNVERYKKELEKAQKHELLKHDVILCTCSTALKPILMKTMDFQQILIDECAMATEPEAFIPLVAHKPKQIVLMGDHKQVRPIVSCARVKEMGMGQSLFERYMGQAVMLDTQYRMHESICQFPSEEFYDGKLKTGAKRSSCVLLNSKHTPTAILFGHVEGVEISLVVSTEAGNENSVANELEAKQAVRVADLLIRHSGVPPDNIAILTPYNAQMSTIKKMLQEKVMEKRGFEHVSVCTIMKSQGSEWPYVIVSTVRSCPLSEIQDNPNTSEGWLGKKLGFVTDPNQVNVAITRAQDGLCILGNHHLLECSVIWKKLLSHYQARNCVINSAQDIKVRCNR
ncbi:3'-5' exoribonuclease HELZ2 [Brachyhypopomus gauderio]|uniref:3'-5' exoribonuclease HELZ2 n=1 Tax=Brachyhypopomus gauderio TaxID=698409 RepID=UPI0040418A64